MTFPSPRRDRPMVGKDLASSRGGTRSLPGSGPGVTRPAIPTSFSRTSTDVLTPDRIKPLLFHDDPTIRRAAIDYFADSWSRDADLIPTMLEVSRRFGDEANLDGLWSCTRFPVTELALDQVLEHL